MLKLSCLLIVLCLVSAPKSARAEPVYEFVTHCKEEPLGHCFYRIQDRLTHLGAGPQRRVCLPRFFGPTMVQNATIPVSVLEYVRLALSSARFGHAGADVDDVMTTIVGKIYHCE